MKLDVSACVPGNPVAFKTSFNLSDLVFSGVRPFAEPVSIEGEVTSRAGILTLDAVAKTELSLSCDRCAEGFKRVLELPVKATLVRSLQNLESGENENAVLLNKDIFDLFEVMYPHLVLAVEMKNLCSEDCAGFCFRCGKNLNYEDCICETDE